MELTRYGDTVLRPENRDGVQEVPAGMTRCVIKVRTPAEASVPEFGLPLVESDGSKVAVDPDGNARPIDQE
jgi:hypothetical protein